MLTDSPIVRALQRAQRNHEVNAPDRIRESFTQTRTRTADSTTEVSNGALLTAQQPKQAPQNLLTKQDKVKISRWMCHKSAIDDNKNIPSRTVRQIPALFRVAVGANQKKLRGTSKSEERL